MRRMAGLLRVAATVTYTSSGYSTLRAARERPSAPIVSLTPDIRTARRLVLVWGVHSVHTRDVKDVPEMVETPARRRCAKSSPGPAIPL
jgi:pyruvate kinase